MIFYAESAFFTRRAFC